LKKFWEGVVGECQRLVGGGCRILVVGKRFGVANKCEVLVFGTEVGALVVSVGYFYICAIMTVIFMCVVCNVREVFVLEGLDVWSNV